MTQEEIDEQKSLAFYASSVDAWYNTSLERDKSLLTLSAGGIGLLITLLTTIGLSSAGALILYTGAILSFLVTLIAVLIIFDHNRKYIEEIILNGTKDNPILGALDKLAFWAFIAGMILTAIIGLTTATDSLTLKEKNMAHESKTQSQSAVTHDSFHGVSNLNPVTGVNKSFNGSQALAPRPIASSSSSTSGSSPAPTSSGATNTSNQGGDGK